MIADKQSQFSDAQAVTADAASTNVIDLGTAYPGMGFGDFAGNIVINCDVALGGTTPTLVVQLQQDDNSAFDSAATILSTASVSALAAGAQLVMAIPPGLITERYIRLNYDVGGTSPTVTLTAGFVADVQQWRAYAGVSGAV